MWKCKHCAKEYDLGKPSEKANHSRWCDSNPKRAEYESKLDLARSIARKKTVFKNQYSYGAKMSEETREKIRDSSKGRTHTNQTKEKLKEKALASNHRRIRKGVSLYKTKNGDIVRLDSSWEVALAKRLDSIGVDWIRPNPVRYQDEDGLWHHYFPDFYLEKFDLYLDPKNLVVYNQSKKKLMCIRKVLPNLKLLLSLKECLDYDPRDHCSGEA